MAENIGARGVHPDCMNASNSFHECTDYCLKQIANAKAAEQAELRGARGVHPDCMNARNSFHECTDYCLKQIANAKAAEQAELRDRENGAQSGEIDKAEAEEERNRVAYSQMNEKQKKLFDLRLKLASVWLFPRNCANGAFRAVCGWLRP